MNLKAKEPKLLEVISKILESAPPKTLQIADYWEADRCAIGLINTKIPEHLVYISIYNQKPNHYYIDLEVGKVDSFDTVTIKKLDGIDFLRLIEEVFSHLGITCLTRQPDGGR